MGHQVPGNSAAFPTDFTVPDDGDAENATSVNVAFGALADRTAFLKSGQASQAVLIQALQDLVGQLTGLNIQLGAANTFNSIAYNYPRKAWVGAGNTKVVQESTNGGLIFAANAISALGGAGDCLRIGCAPDGTMIATTNLTDLYEWNGSAWTYRAASFASAPSAATEPYEVVYDPIRAAWCAASSIAGPLATFVSSTNRFTWASRTLPSGGAAAPLSAKLAVNGATGRVCYSKRGSGGTTTEFAATDDTGVTWLTGGVVTVNHGIAYVGATTTQSHLTWSKASGLFIFVTGNVSTPTSKVYTSTDGTTWTLASTQTTTCFTKIATLGNLWLATMYGNAIDEFAISTDLGVTWRKTDFTTASHTSGGLVSNDVQFLIGGAGQVYASLRSGIGEGLVT